MIRNTHPDLSRSFWMVHLLSAKSPTLIQSDEKFVVIPSCPVDIDAVRIMNISRRVNESGESSIVMNRDLHVVIGTLGCNVC
jgi:hypothetical protein